MHAAYTSGVAKLAARSHVVTWRILLSPRCLQLHWSCTVAVNSWRISVLSSRRRACKATAAAFEEAFVRISCMHALCSWGFACSQLFANTRICTCALFTRSATAAVIGVLSSLIPVPVPSPLRTLACRLRACTALYTIQAEHPRSSLNESWVSLGGRGWFAPRPDRKYVRPIPRSPLCRPRMCCRQDHWVCPLFHVTAERSQGALSSAGADCLSDAMERARHSDTSYWANKQHAMPVRLSPTRQTSITPSDSHYSHPQSDNSAVSCSQRLPINLVSHVSRPTAHRAVQVGEEQDVCPDRTCLPATHSGHPAAEEPARRIAMSCLR
jgi:hypothetical protein